MPRFHIQTRAVPARLRLSLAAAALALSMAAAGHAHAATVTEVDLATAAQAKKYCKGGSLPKGSVAYFNGTAGDAQFASKKCTQAVPTTKVKDALLVNGGTVSECKLATAKQAIALCNAGGIGEYDIAYIAGAPATVIGGPGYGCTTNITTLSIGNAVCQ
jgi:hypothetical protein